MANNPDSWREMKAYNTQDVNVLEKVYVKLLPWIKKHPNHGLYRKDGVLVCPNCGGNKYHSRGTAKKSAYVYTRYQCQADGCGKWFRGNKTKTKRNEDRFVEIA